MAQTPPTSVESDASALALAVDRDHPRRPHADLEALLTAAELPPTLSDLIRSTIRRSRLWRSERSDVARELIAHFTDGLAAGRSPAELAHDFGEPAAAARIIRRAKRRGRPRWWKTARFACRVLGLLVIALFSLYIVLAIRYHSGRPTVAHDYLAQLNAPLAAVHDQDRAWPVYMQALRTLEPLPPDPEGLAANAVLRSPSPGQPGWTEFRAYLARNQAGLDLLRRAAAKPAMGATLDSIEADQLARDLAAREQAGPPAPLTTPTPVPSADHGLVSVRLAPVTHARTLMRLLRAEFLASLEDGNAARATENLDAMLALPRHLREQPFLITELVAQACDAATFDSVQRTLFATPDLLPSDALVDLAHALAAEGTPHDRLARSLETERLGFLDIIQRLYTDDGCGNGHISAAGLRAFQQLVEPVGEHEVGRLADSLWAPLGAGAAIDRRGAIAWYDLMLEDAKYVLQTPRWQRDPMRSPDLRAIGQPEGLLDAARNWPARMLIPALGSLARTADLHRAQRDATLIAIALELHRREHGHFPSALHELVPRRLPAIPADLIDGQPLRYRRIDGRPLVYSIGPDQTDDGGQPLKGDIRSVLSYNPLPSASTLGPARYAEWLTSYGGDWVLYPAAPPP